MAPLVLWLACLTVGIVAFHALGSGQLAPPPMAPSQWSGWATDRDPLLATVALLRLVVLALAWYLVGATGIGLFARLLRAARLVRLADALTVPMVRRLLQGAVGLTMATAVVTASMSPVGDAGADDRGSVTLSAGVVAGGPSGSATLPPLDQGSAGEPGAVRPHPDGGELTLRGSDDLAAPDGTQAPSTSGHLTVHRSPLGAVDESAAGEDAVSSDGRGTAHGAHAQRSTEVPGGRPASEHVVRAGESFWSMAQTMLAASLDRQPTDDEVRGYWRILVAANQDRLAVPGDADLIFPGQRFVMPPVVAVPDVDGDGS